MVGLRLDVPLDMSGYTQKQVYAHICTPVYTCRQVDRRDLDVHVYTHAEEHV